MTTLAVRSAAAAVLLAALAPGALATVANGSLGGIGLGGLATVVNRDITGEKHGAEELEQKFQDLQAVYRMSNVVSRAGALEEIYEVALDELERTVHADRSSVLLYDDGRVMRFRAWRKLSDAYRRAVEGHSPWSPDDADPQPVLVSDVSKDPHLAELMPVFEREGIGAIGFIPLVSGGRLLGKFMIYFNRPHEVSPPELQIAQTIASHIAFAIERKSADSALHESWQAHRLLAEAGALLNSSLEVKDTLASITRLAVPAIADWCFVDLSDDKGGFNRIAVASGDGSDGLFWAAVIVAGIGASLFFSGLIRR